MLLWLLSAVLLTDSHSIAECRLCCACECCLLMAQVSWLLRLDSLTLGFWQSTVRLRNQTIPLRLVLLSGPHSLRTPQYQTAEFESSWIAVCQSRVSRHTSESLSQQQSITPIECHHGHWWQSCMPSNYFCGPYKKYQYNLPPPPRLSLRSVNMSSAAVKKCCSQLLRFLTALHSVTCGVSLHIGTESVYGTVVQHSSTDEGDDWQKCQ